jgi:uncharacterized protein YggE
MKYLMGLATLALAAVPLAALAQSERVPYSIISVTGTGSVTRPPNTASFRASIVTTNDVAAASTSQNNAAYNALREKLAAIGVPETAIRTEWFNVNYVPRPNPLPSSNYGQRYGYTTSRLLAIETSVDGAGKAIDAAVAAGASDISGVQFGLKEQKTLYNNALAAAVADARSQAEALAAAAGVRIVRIRTIASGSQGGSPPSPIALAARAMSGAPSVPTNIVPGGPIEVTATVNISYVVQ